MRARSVLRCVPGMHDFYNSQPRPVQDALAAAWVRHSFTGKEPAAGELPPGVWERARGMVWAAPGYGPESRKGGAA